MITKPPVESAVDLQRPLDNFRGCHAHLVADLEAFAALPRLLFAAERCRDIATATLSLFRDRVIPHHREEEQELFVAVQRSAAAGEEATRVAELVRRLTGEHRAVEYLWSTLQPAVRAAAHGNGAATPLTSTRVAELVDLYRAHVRLEEEVFLPLAQEILGRNDDHLAALGLSLHLRHAPVPGHAYI